MPLSGSTASCTTTASSTTGGDNVIATFSGTDIFWDSLDVFTEVVTRQPCQTLAGCDLSGLDLSGAQWTGADLAGANLAGANLTQADLTDANLTGANLTGTDFALSMFGGADFTGTALAPSNQSVLTFGTSAVVSWPFVQTSLQGATPGRPFDCTPASGSTFPLGTTSVTCPVFDQNHDVATGTFTVTVARPPAVVPYGGGVTEGASGASHLPITVTLSPPSTHTVTAQWNTVFVNGASNVQAVPDTDYTPASGTVTFPPGETTETVPITVVNHDLGMPYKLLVVSFHNPTNAGMGGYYGLAFGFLVNNTG